MPTPIKPVRIATQTPSPLTPLVEQISRVAQSPAQQLIEEVDWRLTVSTGSLVLDKAISGNKTRYGGLPGGVIVEIFGPNSTGKTTILGEIWGNILRSGGAHKFLDAESRLDAAYCRTFGIKIRQEDIERPSLVNELFDFMVGPLEVTGTGQFKATKRNHKLAWTPDPKLINFYGADSLASFVTKMEMEQGDKRGMRRAKEFSEGFRLVKDHIAKYNILMACSNQVRHSQESEKDEPTGGNAIGFYSSVRIELYLIQPLFKEIKLEGMEKGEKRAFGILIGAYIYKNSLDAPYRRVKLRLIFNYGVDDIGSNLLWLKEHGAMAKHPTKTDGTKPGFVVGDKNFISIDGAIKYVEDNNLEQMIRDQVVNLWDEAERLATPNRKPKMR